ncbi:hypothetical protein NDN08_003600 [Rhodosorus marinus]|uniref:PROP1-like PPR domain-containing protein n=1 Tax=Rhodosorus marinus TaxID=101924 RepID=A0AAV8V136_9RHOD|nr:hypothetical protein NDN08_003600 [Rhodosorus marinus]
MGRWRPFLHSGSRELHEATQKAALNAVDFTRVAESGRVPAELNVDEQIERFRRLDEAEKADGYLDLSRRLIEDDKPDIALKVARKMLESKDGNVGTCNMMLTHLKNRNCLYHMEHLVRMMKHFDYAPGRTTYGILLSSYAQNKKVASANNLFNAMIEKGMDPSLRHVNSLLDAHARVNDLDGLRERLEGMKKFGLEPDVRSLNTLLFAQTNCGDIEGAGKVFEKLKAASGESANEVTFNIMLRAYAWSRRFDEANKVFAEIRSRWVVKPVHYNVLLAGLRSAGRFKEFDSLLQQMLEEKTFPDQQTSLTVMQAAVEKDPSFKNLKRTYDNLTEAGVGCSVRTMNLMLFYALRTGEDGDAAWVARELRRVHDEPPETCAFNSLLTGYARRGSVEAVEGMISSLERIGVVPTPATWNILLTAMLAGKRYHDLIELFLSIQKKDLAMNSISYTLFFHALGRGEGNHRGLATRPWLELLRQRHVVMNFELYTSLIGLYAKKENLAAAEDVLKTMISNGFTPKISTFTPMLRGYSRKQDSVGIQRILDLLHDLRIEIDELAIFALAGPESKRGKVEVVEKLLKEHYKGPRTSRIVALLATANRKAGDYVNLAAVIEEARESGLLPCGILVDNLVQACVNEKTGETAFPFQPLRVAEVMQACLESIAQESPGSQNNVDMLRMAIIPIAAEGNVQAVADGLVVLRKAGGEISAELAILIAVHVDVKDLVRRLEKLNTSVREVLVGLTREETVLNLPDLVDDSIVELLVAEAVVQRNQYRAFDLVARFDRNGSNISNVTFSLLVVDGLLSGDLESVRQASIVANECAVLKGFVRERFFDATLDIIQQLKKHSNAEFARSALPVPETWG